MTETATNQYHIHSCFLFTLFSFFFLPLSSLRPIIRQEPLLFTLLFSSPIVLPYQRLYARTSPLISSPLSLSTSRRRQRPIRPHIPQPQPQPSAPLGPRRRHHRSQRRASTHFFASSTQSHAALVRVTRSSQSCDPQHHRYDVGATLVPTAGRDIA